MNRRIRNFRAVELPLLAAIDKRSNKTFWNMLQYEECLAAKYQHIYVLDIDGQIAGFVVIALVSDEVEILQMVIDRKHQNQKLGAYLLQTVLAQLEERYYISKVFLEVASSNAAAQALYKKLGFIFVTTRKNYYLIDGMRVDAIVMMLNYAKL